MKVDRKTKYMRIFGIILMMLCLISCTTSNTSPSLKPSKTLWPEPLTTHQVIENDSSLEELSSISNIFIEANQISVLSATKKMIFVIGSLSPIETVHLLALDSLDGSMIWSLHDHPASLDVTSSALYVGSTSTVTSYDLDTGEINWSTWIPFTRNFSRIYVKDDFIYTFETTGHNYLINTKTGKVTQGSGNQEFFETNAIFTDRTKFLYYPLSNSVEAISRENGKILWQIESEVISNIVVNGGMVYFLTIGGKLVGVDPQTGEILETILFDPNPFTLYNPEELMTSGYYVAIDKDENLLYAYLGDSNQLFAFKILNYPGN